jgi:hypothetical protein
VKPTHFFTATDTWIFAELEHARKRGITGLVRELEQELRNREEGAQNPEELIADTEQR